MFRPTTFGKYFLTRRIAVGGMAEVYAAKLYGSDGFEKDIVIKQILPQYARDPEFVQSFVAEAKIAVSLNHANVTGIYELGRVDGTYFIAMEFVDGLDLFSIIDASKRHNDPLTVGAALLIMEEVAKGLDYAHRKLGPDGKSLGLVHRDLTPRNVLISREGEVKILDFGIAKTESIEAAMPKTRAGVVKGTSGYMSPEQATGRDVDARTDVYQSGLLLFELLTGEPLFWRVDDEETRNRMRAHRVVPPSAYNADVPPELDQIVLSALARNPAERVQTAAELGAMVTRLRFSAYTETNHRHLGEQITRLSNLEAAIEVAQSEQLPSTEEFKAVISEAIENSITPNIETIATRVPSGINVPQKPITGSTPLEVQPPSDIPATVPIEAEEEPEPKEETGDVPDITSGDLAAVLEPTSQQPKVTTAMHLIQRPRYIWVGLASTAVLMMALVLVWIPEPPRTKDKADASGPEHHATKNIPHVTTPTGALARAPDAGIIDMGDPLEVEPDAGHKPDSGKRRIRIRRKRDAGAKVGEGTVGFNTRLCSTASKNCCSAGRVTIDGTTVGNTPIFSHKLSAGSHMIVVKGVNCTTPDSVVKKNAPALRKVVRIKDKDRLKIFIDFQQRQIIVQK